jgi:uncharacterized protein (DUF885 family)
MKPILINFMAVLLLLAACSQNENAKTETTGEDQSANAPAALAALVDEYFERSLELNPIRATSIGDDRYDDRLANWFSPEYLAQAEALDSEFLERLATIDERVLAGQDLISYGTFRASRELSLEGYRYPAHLQPINQFFSIPNFFVQLGSGSSLHPFKTVKNYDDFLGRMDDFVVAMDQAIDNMRIGMRDGVVHPSNRRSQNRQRKAPSSCRSRICRKDSAQKIAHA